MELEPPRRRKIVVERLAHQLVSERVAAPLRRKLGDHAHRCCLAQEVEKPGGCQPARSLEQVQVELPPDHGRDPERRDRLAGEACDAAADQRADLLRNAEEGVLDRLVEACERVLGGEQADDLADEEGVASGDLVQPRDCLPRRGRTGDRPHVRLDVRRRQAAKRDPAADAGQLGERVTELERPPFGLSIGRHEQDAGFRERVAEEAKEQQRRLVSGVDVVQRDEERLLAGDGSEEAANRVEQADALTFGHDRARRPARPRVRVGGRGELFEISSERADDLHPRPVRRSAALLPATAGDGTHAVLPGYQGELAHQPGLADARLAGQEHERPAGGRRLLERSRQTGQLLVAPDERARGGSPRNREWRDLVHGPLVHRGKCRTDGAVCPARVAPDVGSVAQSVPKTDASIRALSVI